MDNGLAIIGCGVAGLTAAIYARRANVEVTIFEQYAAGGLTATIDRVENFPSYSTIEGFELTQKMFKQAKDLGATVRYEQILSLKKENDAFRLTTTKAEYNFVGAIVATGTKHNKLGIEEQYIGKGVSFCATCDGGFFKDREVAICGNLSSTVKEALYLAGICSKVYFFCPTDAIKADEAILNDLKSKDNVEFFYNTTVTKLTGKNALESIEYVDGVTNTTHSVEVPALFVAVGSIPSTDFLTGTELDRVNGFLQVNERKSTSIEGLFAAGDVTAGALKQIVTACSDGAIAGNFAAAYVKRQQKGNE